MPGRNAPSTLPPASNCSDLVGRMDKIESRLAVIQSSLQAIEAKILSDSAAAAKAAAKQDLEDAVKKQLTTMVAPALQELSDKVDKQGKILIEAQERDKVRASALQELFKKTLKPEDVAKPEVQKLLDQLK